MGNQSIHVFIFSGLPQHSSVQVLRNHYPACFRCFPSSTHHIHINGCQKGVKKVWKASQRSINFSQICWSRESPATCRTAGPEKPDWTTLATACGCVIFIFILVTPGTRCMRVYLRNSGCLRKRQLDISYQIQMPLCHTQICWFRNGECVCRSCFTKWATDSKANIWGSAQLFTVKKGL